MQTLSLIFAIAAGVLAGLLLRPKSTPYRSGTGLETQDEEGSQILRNAIKNAQVIVSRAEAEAVRVVAQSKFTTEKLEEKYQEELEKRLADIQADFSQKLGLAIKQFQDHLALLASQSQQTQTQIYERFEKDLREFLAQTQERSVTSIQTELAAARQLIQTYKEQQMALIDENVLAMLEKTLSIVLTKKLSLKDQLDLVYDALEKAKAEKLIV